MRSMKKLVAALLVLTMVLGLTSVAFAATKKFNSGKVEFTGSAYGYEKAGSKRTDIIIKKGSVGKSLGSVIKGGREWVKINIDHVGSTVLYFPADYLKATSKSVKIVFAAGGTEHSCDYGGKVDKKEEAKYPTYKYIQATGDVNIRTEPNLSGKAVSVLRKGKKIKWTGDAYKDCRGVTFYGVKYTYKGQKTCWVSKAYAKLVKK